MKIHLFSNAFLVLFPMVSIMSALLFISLSLLPDSTLHLISLSFINSSLITCNCFLISFSSYSMRLFTVSIFVLSIFMYCSLCSSNFIKLCLPSLINLSFVSAKVLLHFVMYSLTRCSFVFALLFSSCTISTTS